jgi:hypothetical protein
MNGLKVHLRVVSAHRRTLRVITLRAATHASFSTNLFHDTWHILTDEDGARVLGCLLWALSFQRLPGTCVLLTGMHLVPTPFEADPPLPVLLVQDGLAHAGPEVLGGLTRRLRDAPGTTIRLHTFGMPEQLRERERVGHRSDWFHAEKRRLSARETMKRVGGFIVYSAPPAILREQALTIHGMRTGSHPVYHYLAEGCGLSHPPPGEVQVFPGFGDMVSAAKVARREVLGALPSRAEKILVDDGVRGAVQVRAARAHDRLARARRPPRG